MWLKAMHLCLNAIHFSKKGDGKELQQYMTLPATAKAFGLPLFMLRTMQKRGECPGFFQGNRFYCNTTMLAEKLEQDSRSAMSNSKEAAQ